MERDEKLKSEKKFSENIMPTSTQLYSQLLGYFRQYSRFKDIRHLQTLAWMVSALLCSGQLSLPAWEPYIMSRAKKAQSVERRWRRFLGNSKIHVRKLYVPLVMAALSGWQSQRLYVALDTTMLGHRYCMIHLSIVCCGRAIPFLWRVIEHDSAMVAWEEYKVLLRQARWLLRQNPDVMLLADRGFANHDLISWLQANGWHYCLRLPCDVLLNGIGRYPTTVQHNWPPVGEAYFYRQVRLWTDGIISTNLVLANVMGASEPWAVMTDEPPSLQTLWQYSLRFSIEELFLDSKSGVFELEDSRLRCPVALERLYLVAAIAILFATTQGMAVQLAGFRQQVDPHWRRGISYLKIGLRWLRGVFHKGRKLFSAIPLLPNDSHPCFVSKNTELDFDGYIWFSRIRSLNCTS